MTQPPETHSHSAEPALPEAMVSQFEDCKKLATELYNSAKEQCPEFVSVKLLEGSTEVRVEVVLDRDKYEEYKQAYDICLAADEVLAQNNKLEKKKGRDKDRNLEISVQGKYTQDTLVESDSGPELYEDADVDDEPLKPRYFPKIGSGVTWVLEAYRAHVKSGYGTTPPELIIEDESARITELITRLADQKKYLALVDDALAEKERVQLEAEKREQELLALPEYFQKALDYAPLPDSLPDGVNEQEVPWLGLTVKVRRFKNPDKWKPDLFSYSIINSEKSTPLVWLFSKKWTDWHPAAEALLSLKQIMEAHWQAEATSNPAIQKRVELSEVEDRETAVDKLIQYAFTASNLPEIPEVSQDDWLTGYRELYINVGPLTWLKPDDVPWVTHDLMIHVPGNEAVRIGEIRITRRLKAQGFHLEVTSLGYTNLADEIKDYFKENPSIDPRQCSMSWVPAT